MAARSHTTALCSVVCDLTPCSGLAVRPPSGPRHWHESAGLAELPLFRGLTRALFDPATDSESCASTCSSSAWTARRCRRLGEVVRDLFGPGPANPVRTMRGRGSSPVARASSRFGAQRRPPRATVPRPHSRPRVKYLPPFLSKAAQLF